MIVFDQVTKTFPTGDKVLEDINLHIDSQEFIIITGPSGSGKTTLLRLIYKDLNPTKGTITVNGQDISTLKTADLLSHRRQIGFAFQDFKIIPDRTVWENIALSLDILGAKEKVISDRIVHLLALVGIPSKANLFPSQLSGGELQRVTIARAIASEPKILLADEPTGNLDSVTTQSITDLLKQIHDLGTTVILATHDPELLNNLSTRRVDLDKGKIVKDTGKKKKVKKSQSKTDQPLAKKTKTK